MFKCLDDQALRRLAVASTALSTAALLALALPTTARAQACTDGTGAGSIQCGDNADASESGASAVGDNSTASGIFSTAVGNNADASATSATAVGQQADATAQNSTAVGRSSEASGAGATALGMNSIATEENSTAIGTAAQTSGTRSTALGALSTASANGSVALGYASVADEENTVSVGNGGGLTRRITNVADGVNASDAATLGQVQTGLSSLGTFLQGQIDDNTTTLQTHAIAIGAASAQITANTDAISQIDLIATQNAAAIGQIDNRVTALEAFQFNLSDTLERLDKEIDGSTAVAVAMSGNAFLPDKRFNVTANVGGYDGAWAGAIQAALLVSENVAVNAGVATGFNRRGETATRVGVSFGW